MSNKGRGKGEPSFAYVNVTMYVFAPIDHQPQGAVQIASTKALLTIVSIVVPHELGMIQSRTPYLPVFPLAGE